MKSSLTIRDFHQRYQKRLQLSFVSSQVGLNHQIKLSTSNDDSYEAVDYLNVIRPSSMVVIGLQESTYLSSLDQQKTQDLLQKLFTGPVCSLILSQGASISTSTIKFCAEHSIPVFKSELDDASLLSDVRYFLDRALAETTIEHGVYIDVHSIGIFITGDSGVGKSELALALISRGHRLIADDITEFSRFSQDNIDGMHPGQSNDFMEVRGLGILNIRAMFGSNALRRNKSLRMIVNMVHFTAENRHQFDRLGNSQQSRNILGLDIPEMTLPVAPGRNLAVLVEAAARNHLLNLGGYNATDDFIQRQRRAIKDNAKNNANHHPDKTGK